MPALQNIPPGQRGSIEILLLRELSGVTDDDAIKKLKADILNDFLNSVVPAFKDMATEKKGLMDILSERCGLQTTDPIYMDILIHCLTNPDLKDTPLLVLDIPKENGEQLKPENDPCAHPSPKFCEKVFAATDIDEMAKTFEEFFGNDRESKTGRPEGPEGKIDKLREKLRRLREEGDPKSKSTRCKELEDEIEYYQHQLRAYGIQQLKKDLYRTEIKLNIDGTEILISGTGQSLGEYQGSGKLGVEGRDAGIDATKALFKNILNELRNHGNLNDEEAMDVLKQIVLAYRGRNAASDICDCVMKPMTDFVATYNTEELVVEVKDGERAMSFERNGARYRLTSKIEDTVTVGMLSPGRGGFFTSGCRFKFPGDPKVRTRLTVESTRKKSADEIIRWRCKFRETPPRKVIFYGGCAPAKESA
jgi:hypothetical protein